MNAKPNESGGGEPTPFQRFEALVRRVLTTPKADLIKNEPKKVTKRPPQKHK